MTAAPRLKQLELVGRGARSEVYRGLLAGERGAQRPVAIKRLRPELDGDARAVEMFISEARLAVQLAHPNVVHGLELARDDRGYYLVCEWLSGATLAELCDRGERLSPAAMLAVAIDLCDALIYLHRLRASDGTPLDLVHRDVTPSNVFITAEGTAKLGDFGTACWHDRTAVVQPLAVGTPGFAAPEQEHGGADPRCDVYGLGATLRAVTQALPTPLAKILDAATATPREQRFADAAALRQALEGAGRELGIAADRGVLIHGVARRIEATGPARRLDGAVQSILGSALEPPAAPVTPTRRRRSKARPALAGLLVLSMGAALTWWLTSPRAAPTSHPPETPTAPMPLPPEPEPEPAVAPVADVAREATLPRLAPSRRVGTVSLNCVPWAEVTIDGKRYGNTPLKALELAAGRHQLELERPNGERRQFTLEVEPNRAQTFVVDLRRGTLDKRSAP